MPYYLYIVRSLLSFISFGEYIACWLVVGPRVVHTFRAEYSIIGLTLLNNELYLLDSEDQVSIYSTADFTLRRLITMPTMYVMCTSDITSCAQKQCVYVADRSHDASYIHRVGSDGSECKWRVRGAPYGLSVTHRAELLVTCNDVDGSDKLLVLSSDSGQLVRQVLPQVEPRHLFHGLQLEDNRYLVCHGKCGTGRISLVGANGRVIQRTSEDVRLGQSYMAVDSNKFVFVADLYYKRVVLFDSSLKYVRNLTEGLQCEPTCLYFDVVTRRLYLGQRDNSIVVIQL